MTWELIFSLILSFFAMAGIYALLRRLEAWLLGRSETGKVWVLLFPSGDREEDRRRCRRALLSLEAHPLAPDQQLMILDGESIETSCGLMGEKTAVDAVSIPEAAERLRAEEG